MNVRCALFHLWWRIRVCVQNFLTKVSVPPSPILNSTITSRFRPLYYLFQKTNMILSIESIYTFRFRSLKNSNGPTKSTPPPPCHYSLSNPQPSGRGVRVTIPRERRGDNPESDCAWRRTTCLILLIIFFAHIKQKQGRITFRSNYYIF